MKLLGILLLVAVLLSACGPNKCYREMAYDPVADAIYIYWFEYQPTKETNGVCAEIHTSGNDTRSNHWEGKSYFRLYNIPKTFGSMKEAVAWGDSICPD